MERSAELEELLRRFAEAISSSDLEFMRGAISRSPDALLIGTDPDEWWVGYDRIIEVAEAQLKEMSGIRLAPFQPEAYVEGNVGWGRFRSAFVTPDGGETPLRLTSVLHREDDAWKLVQTHVSIGVPNEDIVGHELTV